MTTATTARFVSEVPDVWRAVDELDRFATNRGDGGDVVRLRRRVARRLAAQFKRSAYPETIGGRSKVSRHDVAVALAAYSAGADCIERHARAIAGLIRSDFTNGF
ncbi:hypothetical protein [Mycolicibacterium sphagni]|uniref:hypothetical protein n=1 Tax=Mycolicibacterium sphagni TaxID=1786 RepID=UPI0021F29CAE|nr:hypothetical protein [Mycolicibacterium sphagni]MCV7174844.1 hypothetical protein [Mycolicibacterium sphagni]